MSSAPTTAAPAALDDAIVAESTLRAALSSTARPPRPTGLVASTAFAWRAVLKIKHVPLQLFDVTAFPIMFVLLYTYLFGGALAGSTSEYLQRLLPAIVVMTVSWITMYTGMALNTDISKGVFDRFRSLPIWRPAVLVGMLHGRRRALHGGGAGDDRGGRGTGLPARRRPARRRRGRGHCCWCSPSACRGCGRRSGCGSRRPSRSCR